MVVPRQYHIRWVFGKIMDISSSRGPRKVAVKTYSSSYTKLSLMPVPHLHASSLSFRFSDCFRTSALPCSISFDNVAAGASPTRMAVDSRQAGPHQDHAEPL